MAFIVNEPMPKKCTDCYLCQERVDNWGSFESLYCPLNDNIYIDLYDEGPRPDDCPLIEITN